MLWMTVLFGMTLRHQQFNTWLWVTRADFELSEHWTASAPPTALCQLVPPPSQARLKDRLYPGHTITAWGCGVAESEFWGQRKCRLKLTPKGFRVLILIQPAFHVYFQWKLWSSSYFSLSYSFNLLILFLSSVERYKSTFGWYLNIELV